MSRADQAVAYLEEAKLTLLSARAIYDSASRTHDRLWAHVVKNGYDAIEQAVSAAIAAEMEPVPRNHPAKINTFLQLHRVPDGIEAKLLEWLRRRSDSQYVDIRGEEINVPHEQFDREDAERILADAEVLIDCVAEILPGETG